MTIFTIHEAKTKLSKLIAEVERGGEVVIARGQTPVVTLERVQTRLPRVFGSMKGQVTLDESFFDPLPDDELRAWGMI
jgi:antitoxin (DNA-binding transcriptional repressor) of toxin-antitoxin stability system